MKNILIVDVLTEDKRLKQEKHIQEILGDQYQDFNFDIIHPASEEINLNLFNKFDSVLISGSVNSVYEDFDWKIKLHQIYDYFLAKEVPMLATCFGAQFLAYHLGAKVCKNPKGTEFGPVKIHLTDEGLQNHLIADYNNQKYVFATHNDYIENLPDGATLLASNDNTPIQAFQYKNVLATQFHSDIPQSTAERLLSERKEKYLISGFLKDEEHFEKLMSEIYLGNQSHQILQNFLKSI